MQNNRGQIIIIIALTLSFLYMLPLRNQGFQDDWAYIQSLKAFVQTNTFHGSDWAAPAAIPEIIVAAFLSQIFGFSMKITHLTTFLFLLIASLFFYHLLKLLKLKEFQATIFTLALIFFPWIFQFSFTFLTDVPYLSLLIISLWAYIKGLQTKNNTYLFLGSFLASLAFLTRQLGIILPLAIFLTLIYQNYQRKKFILNEFVAALLPFVSAYFLYNSWLAIGGHQTVGQHQAVNFTKNDLPYFLPIKPGFAKVTNIFYFEYLYRFQFYLHYLGPFLLPLFFIFKIKFSKITNYFQKHKTVILLAFLFYFFLLAVEYFFHYVRKNFQIDAPTLITSFDHLSHVNWTKYYFYLAIISAFFFLPFIAGSANQIFNLLLQKNKQPYRKTFWVASTTLFLVYLARHLWEYILLAKPKIPVSSPLIGFFSIPFKSFFSPEGLHILQFDWLAILLPFMFLLIITYLLCFYQIKRKPKLNPSIFFIMTAFLGQTTMIIFLGHYQWQQYIISFLAYIIIWFSYSTQSWEINKPLGILIIFLLAIFSISLTKNRYEDIGIQWELGTNLVHQGIAPIDIYIGEESWLPWWYYEQTFTETVNDLGGDKYKIDVTSTWRKVKSTGDYVYGFQEVRPNQEIAPNDRWEIISDTGPIYSSIFKKIRFIGIKQAYPK